MKYFKFIAVLFLSIEVYPQEPGIRVVDSVQLIVKKNNLPYYYQNIHNRLSKDIAKVRDTPNPKTLIDYIAPMLSDSLVQTRLLGYYLIDQISRSQFPRDQEILGQSRNSFLNGCLDKDLDVRRNNLDYLINEKIWIDSILDSEKNILVELINTYPDEIRLRHMRFFTSFGFKFLIDIMKSHYLPDGQFYVSSYSLDKYRYYRSLEWETLIFLSSFGDQESIHKVIEDLRNQNDLEQKFRQTKYFALSVKNNLEVANFLYFLLTSDLGKKEAYPIGKGATYSPTFNSKYLYAVVREYFSNPFNEEELKMMEVLNKIKIESDDDLREKDASRINLVIAWLNRTKGNWLLRKD